MSQTYLKNIFCTMYVSVTRFTGNFYLYYKSCDLKEFFFKSQLLYFIIISN